jgi:hypothetical protein
MIKAAPPLARLPKCTRCQSLAKPSIEEYWHIGEIVILFLKVRLFIWSGENNFDAIKLIFY